MKKISITKKEAKFMMDFLMKQHISCYDEVDFQNQVQVSAADKKDRLVSKLYGKLREVN